MKRIFKMKIVSIPRISIRGVQEVCNRICAYQICGINVYVNSVERFISFVCSTLSKVGLRTFTLTVKKNSDDI